MNEYQLAAVVMRLAPGENICFPEHMFSRVAMLPGYDNPYDRVMENVVGSAFEFEYWVEPVMRHVYFRRLPKPLDNGLRTYVSPDRRQYFKLVDSNRWAKNDLPKDEE